MTLLKLAVVVACLLSQSSRASINTQSLSDDPDIIDALNPKLTNFVASDKITLYYNGSGPVPPTNETSPPPIPISPYTNTTLIEDALFHDVTAILNSTAFPNPCTRCLAATELLHVVAITQQVSTVTSLLVRICKAFPTFRDVNTYASDCETDFGDQGGLGPYYAQIFSQISLAAGDMHAWCAYQEKVCDDPPVMQIDESRYFSPKPAAAELAAKPSGKTLKVLHLSDWHLDPRYDIGSEANCTGHLCCRPYSENYELDTGARNASIPASRFGSFNCDSPPDLALSAFSSMPQFFDIHDLAFTIFTGDIVAHDHDSNLSRAYVAYAEEASYNVFKTMLGPVPLYATLGNHDSMPRGFNSPHSLDPDPSDPGSNPLSWNYDLVSSLWENHSWLNHSESTFASTHYSAYATTTRQGLRIISLNSDFWFRGNIFNYIATNTDPDPSGLLSWLAAELTLCESKNQRAWIIAHVPTGYDGINSLPNPSALFHCIVRRFSPATIAGVFFGHTHLDQLHLFYDFLPNSTTHPFNPRSRDSRQVDYTRPLQTAYLGPSITPLMGLNSGYRVYEIDAETFSVVGWKVYMANMSNSLEWTIRDGPVWQVEYDARAEYTSPAVHDDKEAMDGEADHESHKSDQRVRWPDSSPLNATFWHRVTENMLRYSSVKPALQEKRKQKQQEEEKTEDGKSETNLDLSSSSVPISSPPQMAQGQAIIQSHIPSNSDTDTSSISGNNHHRNKNKTHHHHRHHLSLLQKYTLFERKSSVAKVHLGGDDAHPNAAETVCYMRSGSAWAGEECRRRVKQQQRRGGGEGETLFEKNSVYGTTEAIIRGDEGDHEHTSASGGHMCGGIQKGVFGGVFGRQ